MDFLTVKELIWIHYTKSLWVSAELAHMQHNNLGDGSELKKNLAFSE